MAKKLDVETLKKHSFWIGLGAFALFWLIGVIIIIFPAEIVARTKYETAVKAVNESKGKKPKTVAYQVPWNEHGKAFKAHKDKVWAEAWKQQQDMYTWPEAMAFKPKYPADDWPDQSDLGRFRKSDQYPSQYTYLERVMVPVELAGGTVGTMAPHVWNSGRAPTREEIWLVQEDFWVRREMLWIVREAVNSVALFRDVTEEVTSKELGGKQPQQPADKEEDDTAKDADKDKAKDADKAKQADKDKQAKDADKAKQADKAKDADKAKQVEKDKAKQPDKDKQPEKEKPKEAAKPKGVPPSEQNGYRRIFRNANWEIDLRFEKVKNSNQWAISAESSIKNVNALEQTLALANPTNNKALAFRLWQGTASFPLLIEGEPLQFGQSSKLKALPIEAVNPRNPFGVEQVLEWQMSPVRRIEAFETGVLAQSHRTAITALKMREDLKKLDPDPSDGTEKDGGKDGGGKDGGGNMMGGGVGGGAGGGRPPIPGAGGSGGGPPPSGPGGSGKDGGGNSEAEKGNFTPINGINRLRYLHVKEQARHLPVAMRMVVDQSHIHDVLSAVTNSRLRIQITQVSMHHVRASQVTRGSEEAPVGKDGKDGGQKGGGAPPKGKFDFPKFGSGSGSGAAAPPPPPGVPQGGGSSRGAFMPSMMRGGKEGPGSTTGEKTGPTEKADSKLVGQDTTQLVELTVYGIATLYEPYPPREVKQPDPAAAADQKKP